MTIKRREFLAATASAAALIALPKASDAATPAGEDYPVGAFILRRTGAALAVLHSSAPEHVIFETAADGNFLKAEVATAKISEFGTPEGSFEITDTVSATYAAATIAAISVSGN